jgi:Dolichyl-phosphate-mannose-protein mannosyltransferase
MTVTGDWITPYFNEKTRFDKPPLVYWLMAIAYNTLGVNEWAARLPSAVAAIALMGIAFYTLRYFAIPRPIQPKTNNQNSLWRSAWIGSAIIALNPITIVWARTGVADMLLSGCMVSALLCFFIGYAQMGHQGNLEGSLTNSLEESDFNSPSFKENKEELTSTQFPMRHTLYDWFSNINQRASRNCITGASYWGICALFRQF